MGKGDGRAGARAQFPARNSAQFGAIRRRLSLTPIPGCPRAQEERTAEEAIAEQLRIDEEAKERRLEKLAAQQAAEAEAAAATAAGTANGASGKAGSALPFTGEMGSSGSHLLDPNPTTKVAGSAPATALHRADSDPVHAGDEEAMLHELRSGKKALASEKFESTVV